MASGGLGVVLVLAAMVGTWWSVSFAVSGLITASGGGDFGLFGGTTRLVTPIGSQTSTVSYGNATHVGSVFSTAALFAFIGLVLGGGMIGANATARSRPGMRRVGGALGIVAFLLTLLSAVYVMTSLPTAINLDSGATGTSDYAISGFWGTQTTTLFTTSATVAWAAGWGWYAALVAAVLFLIGAVGSFRAPRAVPVGPAPGFTPDYQPPMTPPPTQP